MVLYWTMGSFGAATWGALPVVSVVVPAGPAVLYRYGRALDVLSLGDETAASLGFDPDRRSRRDRERYRHPGGCDEVVP